MYKHILSFICICSLFCIVANGQSTTSEVTPANAQVTYAEFLGTTPPMRDIIPLQPTDNDKRSLSKKNRKAPKNFIGRGKNTVLRPELEHQIDPVLQSIKNRMGLVIEPLVNVEGLQSGFGAPHDPSGDIGKDHYVQAINATVIGVYDKEGNLQSTFTGNSLWSSLGFTSAGDPIVLYDQTEERWIITEFPSGNQLLVAISNTSDPLGTYNAYNFGTPSFPDYPKYAIWDDAIVVTTNEQGPGQLEAYFINKNDLMTGAATAQIQRLLLPGNNNTEAGFFVATPADWTGMTPPTGGPICLAINDSSWGSAPQDQIEVHTIEVDWATPANTSFVTTSVPTAPFDGFPCSSGGFGFACVPQPGGGVDAIPEVIMNQPHYRNFGSHEALVFNFVTDADAGANRSGIRWVELRRIPGGDWELYQEGTFAPADGLDRYMGTICMDGQGNIGLAYNVSSETEQIGIRFTGRRASDPLGEMTVDEYEIVAGSGNVSGDRWGDYAHMSVDPTNDRTFWTTIEYAGAQVRTKIFSFELRRDTIDMGPTALLTPVSDAGLGASETVQIEVKNFGLQTETSFNVGYIFEGGTPVIENVTTTLAPDDTYVHTFTPTVDMSAIGDYNFKIFTDLMDDQAILNDTLRAVIRKLPTEDAGITALGLPEEVLCAETFDLDIDVTNFGVNTLTSVDVIVELNGDPFSTINWTGSLAPGATATETINLTGLMNGVNTVTARTENPNGIGDQITSNDNSSGSFSVVVDGTSVNVNIIVDFWGEETTWELLDETGAVVGTGGPYESFSNGTAYNEELCVSPDGCYTFTINDAYGDGICCGYGDGSYTVTDAEGNVVANGGDFGYSESTNFCLSGACTLTGDISVDDATNSSSNDGIIMITAENGDGNYSFSIDGGVTFQSSNVFENLAPGDYEVIIQDGSGCDYTETVTVGVTSSLINLDNGITIEALPNPTSGIFRINITGLQGHKTFLPLEIFDASGKRIQEGHLVKYNDTYTNMLSVLHYPSGIYFVRFKTDKFNKMVKIVRE